MQKQIKEVKVLKQGNKRDGTPYTMLGVTFTDNTKAATFDKSIENKLGCMVDVELETTDKGTNIKSWILAGPVPIQTPPAVSGTPTGASKPQTPIQRLSLEYRSYCLSYAKDIMVAMIGNDGGMINLEQRNSLVKSVIDIAKEFEKYLNG